MGGKGRDRTVFKKGDEWVQKRNDADRVAGHHKTQKAAAEEAKEMLKKSGGGELTIVGRDRTIRSKDTIAPGNDPRSIKDTEH
jgi:uncharacterized protein YdaU (DUF1376 family)